MQNNRINPGKMTDETSACVPIPHANWRNSEQRLMALIALGNPQLLAEYLEESAESIHQKTIGQTSGVSMAQVKYQGNALAELASRTAIEAGAAESTARAISDGCIQRCVAAEDPEKQRQIVREMLIHFCEAVYTARIEGCSPAVRQCCEHIHAKVRDAISLNELGQVCNLSPHYVSDLFRREMGFGALQYAHQVKLQYAKYLLEYSNLGIAELSSLLSYPSHSNFSQRFKKTYGITPYEYRLLCGK